MIGEVEPSVSLRFNWSVLLKGPAVDPAPDAFFRRRRRRVAEPASRSKTRTHGLRLYAGLPRASGPSRRVATGLVRLPDVAPSIKQDTSYARAQNFTGRPVPGCGAAQCSLRAEAPHALAEAHRSGFDLVV